ncbi:MAG: 2-amino-4-hydroxy-6-hydroxymethyldihydropteridine diphosphokinase, partial [Clostridia bacterium]|nr:2-amino-4-hydroxy-6-hydroxymethyldihydropteridine diphosphokinase [Clostridia bacterium]
DLLMADGEISDDAELTLPHPRMHERGFVLVPLGDLYPDGVVYGRDLREAMRTVGSDGVTLATE